MAFDIVVASKLPLAGQRVCLPPMNTADGLGAARLLPRASNVIKGPEAIPLCSGVGSFTLANHWHAHAAVRAAGFAVAQTTEAR